MFDELNKYKSTNQFFLRPWFGLISLSLSLVNPAAAQVDQQRAEDYFREATIICQGDSGRLWGVSLCGPMAFADARTRTLATNQPRPADDWPRVLGFTNAPIEWGGSRWAAYMWDFTTALPTPRARREFMLHELFHRIQPDLGLMTHGDGRFRVDRARWASVRRLPDHSRSVVLNRGAGIYCMRRKYSISVLPVFFIGEEDPLRKPGAEMNAAPKTLFYWLGFRIVESYVD